MSVRPEPCTVSPKENPPPQAFARGRLIAAFAGAASLAMLGLSFAAVPLYRLFCAATGYAGTPQVAMYAPDDKRHAGS